ncbi:signal peptide peptidase SppA [Pseudomonadota bacterium]
MKTLKWSDTLKDDLMNPERSLLTRFLFGIWHLIDGARKLLLNLVFLLLLYFVILAFIDTDETLIIQPDTALVLHPYGNVVEQYSGTPLDLAIQQLTEQARTETRLRDMAEAIRRARDDDRIVRLVINPNDMWRIGMASLLELEAAIADFKSSGKPVIALADNLSQQQYYLAALADEIWLHPAGMVWIDGFSVYRQFYRDGLDKLEVEVNLFKVGEFKSAMEPFVRDDMSPEAKEANLYWIGGLWQQYLEGVSRHRGIPLENLSDAINDFANGLEAVDGDFGRFAENLGLVDRLVSLPEAQLELARMGAAGSGSEGYRQVGMENYLMLTDLQHRPDSVKKIAVVVAEGDIVRGSQPQGVVGAETMSGKLRTLALDKSVEAVVLRINSPGGEVFASEKVRREVQALKEAGKTVVASMGDVAASGGYWIAMGADEVWASPATITGSIGVFGMMPTFSRPLEKLGIHTDGVGTTPLAGKLRLDRPLDPDLKRIFQHATEQTYRDFIQLVAEARQMSTDDVDQIARGRVWNGAQAKDRGLIDQTGTVRQAIDAAARIAGLGTDYDVQYDERELSTFESFLVEITGSAIAGLGWADGMSVRLRSTLLEDLLGDLNLLARTAGEFSVAAHCLCRVE